MSQLFHIASDSLAGQAARTERPATHRKADEHREESAALRHKPTERSIDTLIRRQSLQEADSLSARVDSTAIPAKRVDYSTALPYEVYGTADSLCTLPGSRPVVYRDAPASKLFGEQSTLTPPRLQGLSGSPSLTDNPVFQSFVLLLAATYAVLLYRNLGDVRGLLGRFSRNAPIGDHLSEEPRSSGFLRFLNITTTIGMLFMGVMIVKYADLLMPQSLLELMPSGAVLGVSLLATAACTAVMFFQRLSLRIAGAVTRSQPMVSQLLLLKRTCFSLTVVIASPALLLYALCPRGTGEVLFYVIAAELIFTVFLYLKESLNLFISKKISILHWFLYLCTVEVFPVSLLILLAAR